MGFFVARGSAGLAKVWVCPLQNMFPNLIELLESGRAGS